MKRILCANITIGVLLVSQAIALVTLSYWLDKILFTSATLPEIYVACVLLYSVWEITQTLSLLPESNGLVANKSLLYWHAGLFAVYCILLFFTDMMLINSFQKEGSE